MLACVQDLLKILGQPKLNAITYMFIKCFGSTCLRTSQECVLAADYYYSSYSFLTYLMKIRNVF